MERLKHLRIALILIIALVLVAVSFGSQNSGTAPNQGAGQAGTPAAPGNVLRILSPRTGERLRQNIVNVQYDLTNSGASAAGEPNYQIKLDSQDPVTTNSTNYTFTGLEPGPHSIMVQLVDANKTPVAGARAEVQFVVLQPPPTPGAAIRLWHRQPIMITAALRVEQPQDRVGDKDQELPSAAGALPLLSVMGFGVLLGGIASAMQTRPK